MVVGWGSWEQLFENIFISETRIRSYAVSRDAENPKVCSNRSP